MAALCTAPEALDAHRLASTDPTLKRNAGDNIQDAELNDEAMKWHGKQGKSKPQILFFAEKGEKRNQPLCKNTGRGREK